MKILNKIILYLIFAIIIKCLDLNRYNFVNQQNYEIDLLYTHILGVNLYFYNDNNSTLFIVLIQPDISLKIKMKMYTNNLDLIYNINNNGQLYFGFDFNINNTDITLPNLRSDIFLCKLNKMKMECDDYAYQINEEAYIENNNGKNLKSI
jgi:hypothetical protein